MHQVQRRKKKLEWLQNATEVSSVYLRYFKYIKYSVEFLKAETFEINTFV